MPDEKRLQSIDGSQVWSMEPCTRRVGQSRI